MARLTIDIEDAIYNRVLDGFALSYGYDSSRDGTKAEFMKRKTAEFLKTTIVRKEADTSSVVAFKDAKEKAEREIIIS